MISFDQTITLVFSLHDFFWQTALCSMLLTAFGLDAAIIIWCFENRSCHSWLFNIHCSSTDSDPGIIVLWVLLYQLIFVPVLLKLGMLCCTGCSQFSLTHVKFRGRLQHAFEICWYVSEAQLTLTALNVICDICTLLFLGVLHVLHLIWRCDIIPTLFVCHDAILRHVVCTSW